MPPTRRIVKVPSPFEGRVVGGNPAHLRLCLMMLVSVGEASAEEFALTNSLLARALCQGSSVSEKVREPEAYSQVKDVKAPENGILF